MTKLAIDNLATAQIFRRYDIRGIYPQQLNANVFYTFGKALALILLERQQQKILLAHDTRLSSDELSQALIQGLIEQGIEVHHLGLLPTPVLYFATETGEIKNAVVVTASHNPAEYNGLKLVVNGEMLASETLLTFYRKVSVDLPQATPGKIIKKSILADYLDCLTKQVQLKRRLKIVIDCANGATGIVAPQLFERLGCEVISLFTEADGNFPNHPPDPTVVENLSALQQQVIAHQADLGLAFDGDGDRIGLVTNSGEAICADRLLMLFAKTLLKDHPGAQILFDVKCSRHLAEVIEQQGGIPVMWKTGQTHLKQRMQTSEVMLAGEVSGHIFFQQAWYGIDDALYAAAHLLMILAESKQTAQQLFSALPSSVSTEELKSSVEEDDKISLMQKITDNLQFSDAKINYIDGVRAEFSDGWGLVRCSNTSPNIVFRFEADDVKSLQRIQQLFREKISNLTSELQLPF